MQHDFTRENAVNASHYRSKMGLKLDINSNEAFNHTVVCKATLHRVCSLKLE